jgi:ATP phosphoribosyltransferase
VDIVSAIPLSIYEKAEFHKIKDPFKKLIKYFRSEGKEKIIVVSEYENIAKEYCKNRIKDFPCRFITSYGATETFINVADMIIDCTETGTTLRENGWEIIDTIFTSTARVIVNTESLKDQRKKGKIDDFLSLVKGALDAQRIRLLKMNVSKEALPKVISILPSMKSPTISKLHGKGNGGYAIEVAVNDDEVLNLIPLLKKNGATDILEIDIQKVVR